MDDLKGLTDNKLLDKTDLAEIKVRWDEFNIIGCHIHSLAFFNYEMANMFGTDSLLQIIHPDDKKLFFEKLSTLSFDKIQKFQETYRCLNLKNEIRYIRIDGTILPNQDNKILFFHSDTDITELETIKNQLEDALEKERAQRNEMETLRHIAATISSSLNLGETVSRILEETRHIVPYDSGTVQILHSDHFSVIGGYGFENLEEVLQIKIPYPQEGRYSTQAIQEKKTVIVNDVLNDFLEFFQPFKDKLVKSWIGIPLIRNGEALGMMALDSFKENFYTKKHSELAELVAVHIAIALENSLLHKRAYQMAMEDSLTKAGTRHSLNLEGKLLIETEKRAEHPLAVIMLDIDHFKDVNDTFGHSTGDLILKRIANICSEELRTIDLLTRYGGEEFLILQPNTNANESFIAIERIRKKIASCNHPEIDHPITVSFGIFAQVPKNPQTLDTFIRLADEALYQAKETGRNKTVIYKQQ